MKNPVPEYSTECLICHKPQMFPAMSIPILGEPGAKERDYIMRLLKHVGQKHTEEFRQGLALVQQFQSFLALSQFRSDDPEVQKVFEAWRADFFRRARKNVPSDANLDELANALQFDTQENYEKAMRGMRAIRDLCCELGECAPRALEDAAPMVQVP